MKWLKCRATLGRTIPREDIVCTLGRHDGNEHVHDNPVTGTHVVWTERAGAVEVKVADIR